MLEDSSQPKPAASVPSANNGAPIDALRLALVLERNRAYLRRSLQHTLHPTLWRHVEADDVLQDVFVIARRRAQEVDLWTEAQIVVWLHRIAMNRVRDFVRHHRRLRRRAEEPTLSSDAEPCGRRIASTDPALDTIRQEWVEIVLACRDALKPEYREVLLLREGFQVSWSTVAIVIDRPNAAAARKLYLRALAEWKERVRLEMTARKQRPPS